MINTMEFIKPENWDKYNHVIDKTIQQRETCDFVRCCNCGTVMLIDNGEEVCPECNYDGALKWEQEGYEEVFYDFAGELFAGMGYEFDYKDMKGGE